jgi:hypothetical protein
MQKIFVIKINALGLSMHVADNRNRDSLN